ncbi:helix-turn-helix domain-containing protein [Bacillus massiliglaciei]|uniref:helix-turn-helix domain-containing protein n=1 Tax=Bacillus massiliglaciei TaxID=1816693 RepID=UPI000DA63455|nr:helix-turn-helix domain-containing protein [Bacillus massiliglaciei]
MAELNVGSVIRELRSKHGMSIDDLAENVCQPEDLWDYERNIKSPTVNELEQIADKLNVDVIYFFTLANKPIFNYIETIQALIKKHKRTRNYKAIQGIVNNELPTAMDKSKSFFQFIKWHQGICQFYIQDDKDSSLETLYEALHLTSKDGIIVNLIEIEILTSIGGIYLEIQAYEKALYIFRSILQHLEEQDHLKEGTIYIRILHTLAQTLTEMEEYEESLELCLKAIEICISNEFLFLFGELFFLTGENYVRLGNLELGIEYMDKSKMIFELQNDAVFVNLVSEEKERVIQSINKSRR